MSILRMREAFAAPNMGKITIIQDGHTGKTRVGKRMHGSYILVNRGYDGMAPRYRQRPHFSVHKCEFTSCTPKSWALHNEHFAAASMHPARNLLRNLEFPVCRTFQRDIGSSLLYLDKCWKQGWSESWQGEDSICRGTRLWGQRKKGKFLYEYTQYVL